MEKTKAFRLNAFDWFLILGTTLVSIFTCLVWDKDMSGFVMAVTGVVNLVLVARGNLWNYAFGIVYNAIYIYVAWRTRYYADAAFYLLYYLPMQFVGWFSWKKNQNADSGAVEVKHLTGKMALVLLAVAAVLIPFFAWLLSRPFIGDAQPWLEATTTAISFVAMFMMVRAIAEQWYIWILLDTFQVVKWVMAVADGQEHAVASLVLFAFALANAVYGLIQWNGLARQASDRQRP